MGKFSRTKGAVAEREVVALAQEHGFPDARRYAPMQAARGGADECADVENVGRLRIEVKRRGKGSMYALAVDACQERPGQIPTLAYREDRGPWLAVVPLAELLKLERDAFGPQRNNPCAFCGSLLIGTTRIAAKALPVPQEPSSCCGGDEGGGCCSSNAGAGAGCAGGKCGGGK